MLNKKVWNNLCQGKNSLGIPGSLLQAVLFNFGILLLGFLFPRCSARRWFKIGHSCACNINTHSTNVAKFLQNSTVKTTNWYPLTIDQQALNAKYKNISL